MSLSWQPIVDIPPIAESEEIRLLTKYQAEWDEVRTKLDDRAIDRTNLDIWIRERNRTFAIATGEIEGLYTLRRGVMEQLITEGLTGIESEHTIENVDSQVIKGLLRDQENTLAIVFDMVKSETPLSHHAIRALHARITDHQKATVGIDMLGRRTEIPLLKGQYKIRPNNPRRPDGPVHMYCAPEQTHSEMTHLLDLHSEHQERAIGMLEQAAWLHHRFVQIHPFQDGNGRTARLLMVYVFVKHRGFPPVIQRGNHNRYISALEAADEGDLQRFVDFLALESATSIASAIEIGRNIIRGRNEFVHTNRGITISGVYHPPSSREALRWDTPEIDDSGIDQSR